MKHDLSLCGVLALILTRITVITAVPSTTGNEPDDLKELRSTLADAGVSPARVASVESSSLVRDNLHQPGFVGCAAAVGYFRSAK